ncbi:uncharacterized protein BJ171DRAFT_606688 [Polychytrium aggregatum]|uniref:uncharacterized protein n=1 Tax=Polychytrium aggregatum TaxID=110093 RepID=UPI0022FED7D1|nr:uncharacterized protein BJ171DRAFT_606688 [Polychytrium aggregatum]KAI9190673.1 hypothetical protein BJ171DRAFT_606688 [Polychytrium aggregatum]
MKYGFTADTPTEQETGIAMSTPMPTVADDKRFILRVCRSLAVDDFIAAGAIGLYQRLLINYSDHLPCKDNTVLCIAIVCLILKIELDYEYLDTTRIITTAQAARSLLAGGDAKKSNWSLGSISTSKERHAFYKSIWSQISSEERRILSLLEGNVIPENQTQVNPMAILYTITQNWKKEQRVFRKLVQDQILELSIETDMLSTHEPRAVILAVIQHEARERGLPLLVISETDAQLMADERMIDMVSAACAKTKPQ